LLEPFRPVLWALRMVAARAPAYAVEVLAPLVDRQSVAGILDFRGEGHVVEAHPPIQQMERAPPLAVTQADFPAYAVDQVAEIGEDDDDGDRRGEQCRPAIVETEATRGGH